MSSAKVLRFIFIGAAVVVLIGTPRATKAQGSPGSTGMLGKDEALVKKGKRLFFSRGCAGCHAIGRRLTGGPDLAGVTVRREADWLRKFLADPQRMVYTDSIAMGLYEQWNRRLMRISGRLDTEAIDALLNYFASQDASRQTD